ncbi:hypothetical protein [Formosa haliotis]|uniref:hypothetical protein n=1 Tax=Formosa haliotis TaxID=1555194 RepID=UPI0008260016|nr:hypothetical protein [Formosa haliotis]
MKKIILLVCLCVCFNSVAQANLNNYKYVIVPNSFDFLKEANQYQLNELTQFLFEKYGFTTVMSEDSIPADLNANGCLGLRSNVLNESNLFTTKLKVQLRDCKNVVVYETEEGISKEKDFKKAYHAALRKAFNSFNQVNYKYEPSANTAGAAANVGFVTQLPEPVPSHPVASTPEGAPNTVATIEATSKSGMLYAQPIANGFQLVDSTPKVVYKLKKSNMDDVYYVEGKQAMVRKSGDKWVLEYYEGEQLKQETLNVKF